MIISHNLFHNRVGIVAEPTVKETLESVKNNAHTADLIELRIDFLEELSPSTVHYLVKKISLPVIITCRQHHQGGRYTGSETYRAEIFQAALDANTAYIDIEHDSSLANFSKHRKQKRQNTKLILSYHNLTTTPPLFTLREIASRLFHRDPDVVKIVPYAKSILDNFTVFSLLQNLSKSYQKNKKHLVSFCTGECGAVSRVLCKKYGSYFTYGSLTQKNILEKNSQKKSKKTLFSLTPGLISLKELEETYNLSMINSSTKVLGVIGSHAEYSCSKYIYNQHFRENNMNYIFLPLKVNEEELSQFIAHFKDFQWSGASVTMPHKEDIIKYLDYIDLPAKTIGAVNTFVNKQNSLKGYNTDWNGAYAALQEVTSLDSKNILVIGAGGAAKAIIYGLQQSPVKITITNRTYAKAASLTKKYNIISAPLKNMCQLLLQHDILINTTSVGMYPHSNESLINKNDFHTVQHLQDKIVMDIVYTPRITTLLKTAQRAGCTIIPGERMLIHQAVEQCKLLTGTSLSLQQATNYFNNSQHGKLIQH